MESGENVVVTGADDERPLTARVAGTSPSRARDPGGRVELVGLAEVLAGAGVVMVGNTGPAHLAAAVGTPVVSPFAPPVPAVRWLRWQVPHVLLGHQGIGCAGCRARQCPVPGHPCFLDVQPSDVLDAVHRLRRDLWARDASARDGRAPDAARDLVPTGGGVGP